MQNVLGTDTVLQFKKRLADIPYLSKHTSAILVGFTIWIIKKSSLFSVMGIARSTSVEATLRIDIQTSTDITIEIELWELIREFIIH